MRTTIRLDDELLERLKLEAQRQHISLTRLVNRVIRLGLNSPATRRKRAFKQPVYPMGKPKMPLDKALALAAELEDAEILHELRISK